MCVKQKFQHRVPNVVLVILIGFRGRECRRGIRNVHGQLVSSAEEKKENEEGTYASTEPEKIKSSCNDAPDLNKGTACVSDLLFAVIVPSSLAVVSFLRNPTG